MAVPTNITIPTQLTSSEPLNQDGILDILSEENEESPEEPKSEDRKAKSEAQEAEGDKESTDEGKEEEPEIKLEDTEENIELLLPSKRQDILKKYPSLFKDFPYLEKAYWRDQKFTEIISTPEEAQELVSKAEQYDRLEEKVLSGDIVEIIELAKKSDGQAFAKIVDNYLPALHKTDPAAYMHIVGNVFKNAVSSMYSEGKRLQNEELEKAAVILNQFIFGSSNYEAPQSYGKPQNTEAEDKIKQREKELIERQFTRVHEELSGRVNNILKSSITEHIDPKQEMTDYAKKNAIRDALETTTALIDQDSQFRKMLDGLWKKAFESDFSQQSVNAIRSAYLGKAKSLLGQVIKKTRAEALKDGSRRKAESKEDNSPVTSSGRAPSTKSKAPEFKQGMRTVDYFMQD